MARLLLLLVVAVGIGAPARTSFLPRTLRRRRPVPRLPRAGAAPRPARARRCTRRAAAPGMQPGAAPARPACNPAAPAAPGRRAPAPAPFVRGSGNYMSWLKILAFWLVFLCWVHTTDWVSTDCQTMHLQYIRWNPIVFGTFMGFFVLGWMLPWFWLGFPLLVIAYVTPLTTYIIYRNQHVALSQRVLTRPHLRYWFSVNLGKLGVKIEAEKKAAWQLGPPVKLEGAGRGERDNRVNTLAARQSLGFNEARRVMAETLGRRATAAMLEFGQQQVDVRYMIDGVWHNDEPQTREVCDPMLESLKLLCGLNPQERQARQKGAFTANYDSIDYAAAVTAQGTATGERIVIQFESEKVQFKTLDDLGMRPKMQEQTPRAARPESKGSSFFRRCRRPGCEARRTSSCRRRTVSRASSWRSRTRRIRTSGSRISRSRRTSRGPTCRKTPS